jgi:hypothetical protein
VRLRLLPSASLSLPCLSSVRGHAPRTTTPPIFTTPPIHNGRCEGKGGQDYGPYAMRLLNRDLRSLGECVRGIGSYSGEAGCAGTDICLCCVDDAA